MATGKRMLEAVKGAIQRRPGVTELRLSIFDVYDLFKLRPSDLAEFGVDGQRADSISGDLFRGSLNELSNWLGVQIVKDERQKNLIPGEGFRRTAGIWATDNDDPDSIVEEIRQLRNPGPR